MGVWGSRAVLSPDQQLFSFPRALVTPLAILRLTRSPVGLENKTMEIGKGSTHSPPLRFLSLSMGAPPETGLASPCPFLTGQCTPSDGKFGYALPVSLSYSWEWATGRKQDSCLLFCHDWGAIPTCPVGDKACPTLLVSQPAHLISPTLVLWLCLYLYQG